MRNLIAFLQRFRIFLVFAVLQILALTWYVTYLSFPRNQFLTTNNNIAIQFLEWEHDLTKHFNLSKNNTELQWENIYWRKRQPKFMYQLSRSKVKVNDTIYEQQYTYIPAEVINSSIDRRNNYFTLNVGTAQGIKRGMAFMPQVKAGEKAQAPVRISALLRSAANSGCGAGQRAEPRLRSEAKAA